jgi:SEL1 protein
MFNLGYMHEFGAGVPQDLQLSHQFYGMAKHTNKDATLAVVCAHTWLAIHRYGVVNT